jgi:LPXTG-motif cell wall-anchored protein
VGEDGVATGGDVQYVDCSQVQAAVQGQYGDAGAAADDESIAASANNLGISQSQVNACLGEINVNSPTPEPPPDGSPEPYATPTPSAPPSPEGTLPETGGASLLALGAGALLVAGGLLARRIVR